MDYKDIEVGNFISIQDGAIYKVIKKEDSKILLRDGSPRYINIERKEIEQCFIEKVRDPYL